MGCCCSGLGFESVRKAEAQLLQHVGEQLNGRGRIARRDILLEVDDLVVKHAIIHFIELLPPGLTIEVDSNIECFPRDKAFVPMHVETQSDHRVAYEKTPLVLLPGFGIGAAAFAPCMETLMTAFPDRHIFILDWPSSGAAPRMPWSYESRDRFLKGAPKMQSASLLHKGVVHVVKGVGSEDSKSQGHAYPLPEKRFVMMMEAWRMRLGMSKMILIGHSIGGYISFNYAETYPQHVERLILCSPCGLALRPDAFGISEAVFSDWMDRIDEEEPQYANEFAQMTRNKAGEQGASRPALKLPKWTCCDRLWMSVACIFCLILSPVLCLIAVCFRIKMCLCGQRKRPRYEKTFPQNGTAAKFHCDWEPLADISPQDYDRMYVAKAVPPMARTRSLALPACAGRRGGQLFAEVRFADNGQWLESLTDTPSGSLCTIVSGGNKISESRRNSESGLPSTKVSRELVANYGYYISEVLPQFNWGEKLFEAIQFTWSYRSYGWCRRPIGKRVERFLGLPPNFEGGSEFYTVYCPISATSRVDVQDAGSREDCSSVPVAFFYGISDWMPFRAAKLISEKVSRHRHEDVPVLLLNKSGHQMFIDNPKGFVEGIQMLVA